MTARALNWILLALLVAASACAVWAGYQTGARTVAVTVRPRPAAMRIYVVNHARQYISDADIRNDIPAWEAAANRDFAPVWGTPQVRITLLPRGAKVPAGAVSALFVPKGNVQGALAYHWVANGAYQMVMYAGVARLFNYSNSVDFTHELFEMLADPEISITNQGYPYYFYTVGQQQFPMAPGTVWANEVCDPVEEYTYTRPGANGHDVRISDFITPNWFNDEVSGNYDFTGVTQAPFTIARGGYAQYWDGLHWNIVKNFRGAGRDAAGFLKGEKTRGASRS